MKQKRTLAFLLALVMVLSLCTFGAGRAAADNDVITFENVIVADDENVTIELINFYESILNTYTQKMKDAVPGLVASYRSEAAGISDIGRLALICNNKVGELSSICNEGIGKMAEQMYSAGDSYSVYEKWAGKLMDNYMDIAMEIQNAYLDSAIS